MVQSTFLLDLKADLRVKKQLSFDHIASTALMGSVSGLLNAFDETKTYNRGDKVPYVTNNGELVILVCVMNDVTGPINPLYWEEWNIMDELEGLYHDYVVASWNKPSLRRNKVWLAIKTESIQVAKDVLGEYAGLLIYDSLIISNRKPIMTKNVIWGQITEEL